MKSKAKNIPGLNTERKVSAIVGRGARAKNRKGTRTTPAFVAVPVLPPEDDEDENFDEPPRKRKTAKKVAQVKDVHTGQVQVKKPSRAKGSKLRQSRAKKAVHTENAWVSFKPAERSQKKDEVTDPVGSSPQPVKSSTLDSVQPPPNVSPNCESITGDTDSTIPSVLEESTSSPESAEELTEESPSSAPHIIALAQFQKILSKHPRMLAAAAVFTLFLTGFLFGRLQSGSSVEEEERDLAKPTPQLVKELNEALALIETGQSSEALQKIQALSAEHPDVSSLDYLAALSAMQAGDLQTAQEKAALSITKNQKVSDSLVLLSMTESGAGTGGKSSLRDPKIVRESLLREAVNADVANPFPMIELASFLRGQKRDEEALDLLRAANARLHPIDTHVVVQTSIQLMQMPEEQLPAASSEGSITEIFSSVYISLRKKDYNQAAIVLEKGRQQAAPDLFAYLINDPVFKPFLSEPVMTRAL
jgi:tetratricopeptide (TPR) repeat protein